MIDWNKVAKINGYVSDVHMLAYLYYKKAYPTRKISEIISSPEEPVSFMSVNNRMRELSFIMRKKGGYNNASKSFKCPHCSARNTKYISSKFFDDGRWKTRYMQCLECMRRFKTVEKSMKIIYGKLLTIGKDEENVGRSPRAGLGGW